MRADTMIMIEAEARDRAAANQDEQARLRARVDELEALVSETHTSVRRFTLTSEAVIRGLRYPPGTYTIMRIGPVADDDEPAF